MTGELGQMHLSLLTQQLETSSSSASCCTSGTLSRNSADGKPASHIRVHFLHPHAERAPLHHEALKERANDRPAPWAESAQRHVRTSRLEPLLAESALRSLKRHVYLLDFTPQARKMFRGPVDNDLLVSVSGSGEPTRHLLFDPPAKFRLGNAEPDHHMSSEPLASSAITCLAASSSPSRDFAVSTSSFFALSLALVVERPKNSEMRT